MTWSWTVLKAARQRSLYRDHRTRQRAAASPARRHRAGVLRAAGQGVSWKSGSELEDFPVNPGDVVRIPVATPHTIHCTGNESMRYLAVDCFPGSRPEAEPTWDAHVQVSMSREQGGHYDEVREA